MSSLRVTGRWHWLRQYLVAVLRKRLGPIITAGLSPRKLAVTICLGTACGIMPLIWGTSLLCIVLARLFRLNHLALQTVNYLLYPLQLALMVPFFRLGRRLFGGPPVAPDPVSAFLGNPDPSSMIILFRIMLTSLAAWLVTVLPAALLVLGLLVAVLSGKTPEPAKQ